MASLFKTSYTKEQYQNVDIITSPSADYEDAIAETQAAVEECSRCLDSLDTATQLHVELTTLPESAPESISNEAVQTAQETFAYAVGRLGLSKEEYKQIKQEVIYNYSIESNKTPLGMYIALEGPVGRFIERLIQKIKDMFKAFVNIFKNLMLKARKIGDITKQRAKVLLDSVDEEKEYNVDGDALNWVNKTFISMQVIPNSYKNGTLEIKEGNNAIKKMVSEFVATAQAVEANFKTTANKNWKSLDSVLINGVGRGLLEITTIPTLARWVKQLYKGKTKDRILIIRFMNRKLKVVVLEPNEQYAQIETYPPDGWENLKPFSVNGKTLKDWLQIAYDNASNLNQFESRLKGVAQEARKTIDNVKSKEATDKDIETRFMLQLIGRLSTSVILDMTINYMDFNKAIVQLCSKLISGKEGELKAGDEKHSKTAE